MTGVWSGTWAPNYPGDDRTNAQRERTPAPPSKLTPEEELAASLQKSWDEGRPFHITDALNYKLLKPGDKIVHCLSRHELTAQDYSLNASGPLVYQGPTTNEVYRHEGYRHEIWAVQGYWLTRFTDGAIIRKWDETKDVLPAKWVERPAEPNVTGLFKEDPGVTSVDEMQAAERNIIADIAQKDAEIMLEAESILREALMLTRKSAVTTSYRADGEPAIQVSMLTAESRINLLIINLRKVNEQRKQPPKSD